MKKQRILMIFILVLSPMFLMVMMAGNVKAEITTAPSNYWDKFTVLSSHFRPELYSDPDLQSGVRMQKSAPVLESFTSLDTKLISQEGNIATYEYRSKVSFLFDVNFYMEITPADCYLGRYESSFEKEWLVLRTKSAETGMWTNENGADGESFTVRVSDFKLGGMSNKGYNGYLTWNMQMSDPTPREVNFGNGVIMNPIAFVATLEESVFVSSTQGDIASNSPIFTPEINVGVQSVALDEEVPVVAEGGQTILNEAITNLGIGVTGGPEQSTNTETNTQIGQATTLQGRLVNDCKFWLTLKPNVARNYQEVTTYHANIDVDTVKNLGSPPRILNSPVAVKETDQRTLGATVTNKYISARIRVTFVLLSTSTLDVQQTSTPIDLETPGVYIDDQYWNNFIEGETGVTITEKTDAFMTWIADVKDWFDNIFNWFDENFIWIIVAIVAVVALGGIAYFRVSSAGPRMMAAKITEKSRSN